MPFRFAHLADLHIGAHTHPILREIELSTLELALTECITKQVDFLLISGDIFDSNVPDMYAVDRAVKAFKDLKDKGIPIYTIFGSHDFTVAQTSIVNVLISAGIFTNVGKGHFEEKIVTLKPADKPTDTSAEGSPAPSPLPTLTALPKASETPKKGTKGSKKSKAVLPQPAPPEPKPANKPPEKQKILHLEWTTDPKTGVKMTGIGGRIEASDLYFYEILDRKELERVPGVKLFLFHTAIKEYCPEIYYYLKPVPLNLFPHGCQYLAGGHLHKFINENIRDYGRMVYPGALFAGQPKDLEETARGEDRGFVLVEGDENAGITDVQFVSVMRHKYTFLEYTAENKSSKQVNEELPALISKIEVKDRIVVIKVAGTLAAGATTDVDFRALRNSLLDWGAKYVSLNRFNFHSRITAPIAQEKLRKEDIERQTFSGFITNAKAPITVPLLKGDTGVQTALQLTQALRTPRQGNEKAGVYTTRMEEQLVHILQLDELLKGVETTKKGK